MSKIEDLIKQYCPNGCEWKRLGDVCDITSGSFVKKDKQSIDGRYLVYNGGITHTGYYDEYNTEADKVIISARGAGAGFVNHVMTRFWAGNSCFVLNIIHNTMLRSRFLYYVMTVQMSLIIAKRQEGSIPAVSKNQLMLLQIPVPHIAVQDEIVRILDKFTELEKELEKELEMRRKQYEFYRDKLLTFDGGRRKKVSEITNVLRGKRLTKTQLSEEGKFSVFHGGLEPLGKYDSFNRKANTVMIINVGASAGTVGYCKEDFWSSDGCFCLSATEEAEARYLYFVFQSNEHYLISRVRKAGIPILDAKVIEDMEIPVPSLTEQERIVKILDKFDTLTTDLTFGLPAEIKLRKQQYEYYRDYLFGLLR